MATKAKATAAVNGPATAPAGRVAVARKAPDVIELQRLVYSWAAIPIRGLTPFIPHRWSEKSKKLMPGHPEGDTVKGKKGLREPQTEAEACVYRCADGRPGIPATAFKAALVHACRLFDQPSMVEAKQLLFVVGDERGLVPFEGIPRLREDTPRNSNGSADLRYRYEFSDWTAQVVIRFIASSITPSSVATLLDAAGNGGVGDWRPSAPKSCTGTAGTWMVDDNAEVKVMGKEEWLQLQQKAGAK
jgi:hypothetical protein